MCEKFYLQLQVITLVVLFTGGVLCFSCEECLLTNEFPVRLSIFQSSLASFCLLNLQAREACSNEVPLQVAIYFQSLSPEIRSEFINCCSKGEYCIDSVCDTRFSTVVLKMQVFLGCDTSRFPKILKECSGARRLRFYRPSDCQVILGH